MEAVVRDSYMVLVLVGAVFERVRQVSFYGVKLQRSDDLQLVSHPDGCTEDTFDEWCSQQLADNQRLAVDLFSGAGGLSLGLEEAGWTVAVSVDNNDKALQTHRHNFPGLALARDLGDETQRRELVSLLSRTTIDLVAGGPPCQPFSRAGRSKIRSLVVAGHREEHDHRRELWQAFLDIALAVRPRAVLMENVPDMALGDDFAVVRTMADELERAGYYTDLRLVDAWRYGVPQHRKRLILLARRDIEDFPWPEEQEVQTTLWDAIGDLPDLKDTTGGRVLTYRRPRELPWFGDTMRAGAPDGVIWDHMTRPVRDDDRKIFELMDSTTLYANIPKEYRRYKVETFDDKYKKLDWKSVSRSITAHIAKDGYWYIHPEQLRTLTVREAARVQTFPDRFRFAGTRSDAFRQIGNAVPPMLGQAVATALRPVSQEEHEKNPHDTSSRWGAARNALTTWAHRQQRGKHWHSMPGPGMTPAVAAIAAILTSRVMMPKGAEHVLESIRGRDRLTKAELEGLQQQLATLPARRQLERFRPLLPKRKVWSDPELLVEQLNMKPAEEQTFRLLAGQDVLLATQTTLRVAARVVGSDSDKINRLSDGRVDLARLIGAGQDAPIRAAALRLIGSTVCKAPSAVCPACPLSQQCVTATADRAQTLF
ncbi:DNA cytosine methyltransferase [Nocardia africana]|uniref:Cytosine-specific methyltransferase n=1 Tax=Nocardia africana TaxID=134964 RepID=A0A378X3N9_9NOCA|nr:DNA cytosine methyltransferase [Nocardia africana]MCC3311470.1 DNA cytosine methyltransferase [Nocardia africana]SUA47271.1 Modification methylase HaeIII [Nocardia africana]